MDPTNWQTYLVTQASNAAGRSTMDAVNAAIEGGIDAVQLREKGTTARLRYELGKRMRERTRVGPASPCWSRPSDLAMALEADGVHLGQSDLPVSAARDLLGPDTVIGCSTSTVAEAEAAVRDGADYLGVGAVYRTDSKDIPDEELGVGPERIEAITDAVSVPVVGIRGITPDNAGPVVRAGAAGVAVITAITAAEDPQAATEALREAVANV